MIHELEQATGILYKNISLDDKEIFNVICQNSDIGTEDIFEFGTDFMMNILAICQPQTIEEIAKCEGFAHGTDVWLNNAENLIEEGISLNELIANRDDIMNYLVEKGIERELAFEIMEFVRRGKTKKINHKKFWNNYEKVMKEHNVPNWYISSCEKISYLFPKAHAISYAVTNYKLVWYKVYYPSEFEKVKILLKVDD